MTQSAPPDAIPVTPVVITGAPDPSREVSMIDVTVSAFTLTGYIMGGALIAGFRVVLRSGEPNAWRWEKFFSGALFVGCLNATRFSMLG